MGKIQIPKKIRIEDFDEKYQDLIQSIAYCFNPFSDEVYKTLSGNVDYSNLNRQIVTPLDLTLNASGQLINPPNIKYTLTTKLKGITVLNVQNLVNSNTYPLSQPFISWTINGQIITILNISGLQPGSQYRLTLELIG